VSGSHAPKTARGESGIRREGSTPMEVADIDLNDLDLFERGGFPYEAFAELRARAPVWWHPPSPLGSDAEGFWVVVDYAHTRAVSRDAATFSSETGGERPGGGTTLEDLPIGPVVGAVLAMSDGANHARMRSLVSRAFTPRALEALEVELRRRTDAILDEVTEAGECDFVRSVARELPLQVIADMLGVAQSDRHELFENALRTLRPPDPKTDMAARAKAGAHMIGYAKELIAEKRARPDDSILSTVIHGADEHAGMSQTELEMFFSLLWSAGSETTRNAISGSLIALTTRPQCVEMLRTNPDVWPTAVEELLRFVSPVTYNRRTVTRPTELGGETLAPGDKVSFWYPSANRDPAVFREPDELDLWRRPNPHLAFNIGEHVCLGANLARREIRILLEAVLARWTDIELSGPVRYARTNKHGGIDSVPIRFRRR